MSQISFPLEPTKEYRQRLQARRDDVERLERVDGLFSLGRGLSFLAIILCSVFAFGFQLCTPLIILLPCSVFILLIIWHGQVALNLSRANQSARYYERGIDRLEDRWIGIGPTGERYFDTSHPYTADLDIFGDGSLFQLICIARTRPGEDCLANWIAESGSVEEIRQRQQAINELRSGCDLREEMALLDSKLAENIDQNRLLHWAAETPQPVSRWQRVFAGVLGCCAVAGVCWWAISGSLALLLLVIIIEGIFYIAFRKRIKRLMHSVDEVGAGLAIFSDVLQRIEKQSFQSTALLSIQQRLEIDGKPPSERIALLNRLIRHFFNSMQNQFFAPIAFALCLTIHWVHQLEKWRLRVGTHIPDWLQAVGEYEALSSLAQFAFEHPEYPFPELVENELILEASGIGHPLLPGGSCVHNNIELNSKLRLLMVSGSNMSGKSTLLRTIGVNVALGLAGAPVCADSMKLSLVQIGTAMRIHDSLMEGHSLFYAVIARLKGVVTLSTQSKPLCFLLDEILQGTNSHDRRVGAEGVIRSLLNNGAIGLVTTHDLALTNIVDDLAVGAQNIHFEDQLVDGTMQFDYHIRPGVVQRSNALELMKMIGLQFDIESPS